MNELALFNNLFDGFEEDGMFMPSFNFKKAFASPKVDVKEDKDAYTLEMDLPGKTDKDINIELSKNILTISSEEKSENEKKDDSKRNTKYLLKERSYSKFSRSFALPDDVDYDKLSAKVCNGILNVYLPRKALASPRKITIEAM